MKLRSALLVTALLGAGTAFAATTPPASSTSATPASSTAAPAAHSTKGTSLRACNKHADDKKLTGDARTSYVKDCRAGKTSAAK